MRDEITSVESLVEIVCSFGDARHLYRGETDYRWSLVTGIGRRAAKIKARGGSLQLSTSNAMRVFKSQYCALYPGSLGDPFEIEALAQHHGVPTRLIDWSLSPLVALYFAVESAKNDVDASLYLFDPDAAGLQWVDSPTESTFLSYCCDTFVYMPRHIDGRLRAQQGIFTCHANPEVEFKPDRGLRKLRIPSENVANIKFQLLQLGIGARNVYPDLGGLGQDLRFRYFDGFG